MSISWLHSTALCKTNPKPIHLFFTWAICTCSPHFHSFDSSQLHFLKFFIIKRLLFFIILILKYSNATLLQNKITNKGEQWLHTRTSPPPKPVSLRMITSRFPSYSEGHHSVTPQLLAKHRLVHKSIFHTM